MIVLSIEISMRIYGMLNVLLNSTRVNSHGSKKENMYRYPKLIPDRTRRQFIALISVNVFLVLVILYRVVTHGNF